MKKITERLFILKFIILPVLAGLIIGMLLYLYFDLNKTGLLLLEIFTILGLSTGIYWGMSVRRKENPSQFFPETGESKNRVENSDKKK